MEIASSDEGRKKYYVVAHRKKKTIYKNNYRKFLKIIKNPSDAQFLKKKVYGDEEVKDWLEIFQNMKNL